MSGTEPKPSEVKALQSEYDRLFTTEGIRDEQRGYRFHARRVLAAAPNQGALLDVACGGGYFFSALREEGAKFELTGSDFSQEALKLARKECASARYIQSTAESLPFPDGTYDVVTCLGSMEHFFDIPGAIKQMIRVAKPGARFFILLPNKFWYKDVFSVLFSGYPLHRNQTQERFASPGEWRDTIEGAGLEVLKMEKYNGIARRPAKQLLKDLLIPKHLSYHVFFTCKARR